MTFPKIFDKAGKFEIGEIPLGNQLYSIELLKICTRMGEYSRLYFNYYKVDPIWNSSYKATNSKKGKKRKQNFNSVVCNLLVRLATSRLLKAL